MDKYIYAYIDASAYIQPKLNQEDINHLNIPFTYNEIEVVTVSLQRKAQDLVD
jgi:hypothetical protein